MGAKMEFDKELVNNYGFDLRRLRSSELTGLPYLVRKGTPGWNFAVEHKTLVSFQEGFQAVLESNLPIWTINEDPMSDIVEGLLRKEGYTSYVSRD